MTASALDVILAALAVPLTENGMPERVRSGDRARLIEAALIEYGHLPDPDRIPALIDYEQTAAWLAEVSGFARYAGDGWSRILESEGDVECATTHALRRCAGTPDEARVQEARRVLLGRHAGAGAQ